MKKSLLFTIVAGLLVGSLVPDSLVDYSFEWWSFIILGNLLLQVIVWCLPKGGFRITNVKLSTDVK